MIIAVAADVTGVVGHGVDDLGQCAVEVGPPELVALRPVEFVPGRVEGDLQRFGGVGGEAGDDFLDVGAVEVGAPDGGGLAVVAGGHFAPVQFAMRFVNGDVGDDLAGALDEHFAPGRVAEDGTLDAVGQDAIGLERVVAGADVGHRLRRHGGGAMTEGVAGA